MHKKVVSRFVCAIFGWMAMLIAVAPAQNLGLGSGRASAEDSAARVSEGRDGAERPDDSPRKSQMNRRLGLSARRAKDFDPKVYEARGKELQGEFYEIFAPGSMPGKTTGKNNAVAAAIKPKDNSRQMLVWVGVAGAVGAGAAVAGYLMLQESHPSPGTRTITLTDDPNQQK